MISKWIMVLRCYKLYKYALKHWRKKDVTMLQSLLRFPSFPVQAPKLHNIKIKNKNKNLNRPITGLTNHPYMINWSHETPLHDSSRHLECRIADTIYTGCLFTTARTRALIEHWSILIINISLWTPALLVADIVNVLRANQSHPHWHSAQLISEEEPCTHPQGAAVSLLLSSPSIVLKVRILFTCRMRPLSSQLL